MLFLLSLLGLDKGGQLHNVYFYYPLPSRVLRCLIHSRHGLSRLKMYCDRISKKVINPKPKIKIKKISTSISHIDANNSIGFVAADLGIKTAIKHAQKTGIGMVAVKNSGHYGLSGYYAEQAVKKNLIAMIYTNAPPAVAPHGALKTLFGTNPICFCTNSIKKSPVFLTFFRQNECFS